LAKLAQNFAKYVIHAQLKASGIVEKPDVIGAIFGQTEGLLGVDMDLRELQRTGRVGRIEVKIKTEKGNSIAEITIPCSLDASETALIAASLETIEKVGPCDASIKVMKVEDVRSSKRQYVVERAKEILKGMMENGFPDTQKLSESIKEAVRSWEVSEYQGLSCGPDIENYDEIIIVEGRADVINLLKNGIRNVIAIEGSKIPQAIIDLTKKKITTAFLDGDRGGDLDLKKLLAVADIDFVARAEPGYEVEELSKKQIYKALRDKVPVDQIKVDKKLIVREAKSRKPERKMEKELSKELKDFFKKSLEELIGTRAAYIVGKNYQVLSKIPISELGIVINEYKDVFAIIIDDKINQLIVDMAAKRKIPYLVSMGYKERVHCPTSLKILTSKDLNL